MTLRGRWDRRRGTSRRTLVRTGTGRGRRITDRVLRYRHAPALFLYTAATVVLGLGALLWATLNLPIDTGIALDGGSGPQATLLGLGYWVVLGLLGSIRVSRFRGHGVLTFHLPFIVAAMTLGGPVAAGWVALIATTEMREIREVPWFGILANHAGLALSAVTGGLVMGLVRTALGSVGLAGSQSGDLLAILLGTVAFTTLSIGLAIGVVVLRDGLSIAEFFSVYDGAHRSTASTEAVLGWLLALVFRSVGWWAPIVCAVLVLLVWDAYDARETARRDPMTGLLTRLGFNRQLERAVRRARSGWQAGALIGIDLDGFKAINDTYGHATGDAVLRATGARLERSIRLTDAASRLGGDEFAVLLLGVNDEATAEALARRLLTRIREPIEIDGQRVAVGGSFGVVMLRRRDREMTADGLHRLADTAMYEAKRTGGGVHLHGPDCRGADGITRGASPALVRTRGLAP